MSNNQDESIEITRREYLIAAALWFAKLISPLEGVKQIALIGSLTTNKKKPKDADVLVTVEKTIDFKKLAESGRKFKGKTAEISCGADIFLTDVRGKYLGRTCGWRECRAGIRMSCRADHCGRVPYLYDDLRVLNLSEAITANSPLVIYPKIIIKEKLPDDLMKQIRQFEIIEDS